MSDCKLIEKCKYDEDKELIESLCEVELEKFEKWFYELENLSSKDRIAIYNGANLYSATGVKCWFDSFVDGLTPREALDNDYGDRW